MSDDKSAASSLLAAAKAKVNEGADRLRAAGHEAASHVGGSAIDNLGDKAKAVEDRAKAEVHNAQADANFKAGTAEAKDGDGH